MQGSWLQLRRSRGKDQTFYFTQTFDLTDEPVETKSLTIKMNCRNKELQDISILLVEDNPLNVMVAKAFLERCGAHDRYGSKRRRRQLKNLMHRGTE